MLIKLDAPTFFHRRYARCSYLFQKSGVFNY